MKTFSFEKIFLFFSENLQQRNLASLLRRDLQYETLSSALWYCQSGKTNTCPEGKSTSERNRNYSLYNHYAIMRSTKNFFNFFNFFFFLPQQCRFFFNYMSFHNGHIIFLPIVHNFFRAVLTERSVAALHPELMWVPRIVCYHLYYNSACKCHSASDS